MGGRSMTRLTSALTRQQTTKAGKFNKNGNIEIVECPMVHFDVIQIESELHATRQKIVVVDFQGPFLVQVEFEQSYQLLR